MTIKSSDADRHVGVCGKARRQLADEMLEPHVGRLREAPTPPPTCQYVLAITVTNGLRIRRADTFLSRLAGLLAMAPLRAGEGLLLAPCASVHTAFMRYAIDVVFLDRAGVIKKIVPALRPWRVAACAGAYQTLELAAGEAARLQILPGQRWPKLAFLPL